MIERGSHRPGIVVSSGGMEAGNYPGGREEPVSLTQHGEDCLRPGDPDEVSFVSKAGPQGC